jgi:hypothetical protein
MQSESSVRVDEKSLYKEISMVFHGERESPRWVATELCNRKGVIHAGTESMLRNGDTTNREGAKNAFG